MRSFIAALAVCVNTAWTRNSEPLSRLANRIDLWRQKANKCQK